MLNKTPPSTPSSGRDSKQKLMTPDIPLLKSILKTPNTPRNSSGVHFEPPRDLSGMYSILYTGKVRSTYYGSTNPQYDKRLFTDFST